MPGFPSFLNTASSSDRFDYDGLPPELASEAQAVNRRQQMANYLMQQGLQPHQGQMVGRFYVPPSPIQGLAGLAQVAAGVYSGNKADEARKGISTKSQAMLADAMQRYKEASGPVTSEGPRPTAQVMPPPQNLGPHAGLMPQPDAAPTTVELPGPGAPVQTPRSPEEKRQAIVEQLMLSTHPQAQAVGKLLAQQVDTAEQRGLDRDVRREGLASNAELRKGQIEANLMNTQALIDSKDRQGQDTNALKAELAKQQAELQKSLHSMDIAGRKDVATIMADSRKDSAGLKAGAGKEDAEKGKENLGLLIGQLHDYYDQLNKEGGITSTGKGSVDNAMSRLSSSAVGQTFGGVVGSKNQSLRDSIAQQRPLLMQAIMKANKMTAKSMDSNVELKLWLATATDPTLGYEANKRALDMLEKLYGGGGGGGEQAAPVSPSQDHASAQNGVPPGAKQIGTSKGKPVYQLPDGSKVIAE